MSIHGVNVNYWFGMVMRTTADYVITHFSDEEQLMVDVGYPDFHKHKLMHMEIVDKLKYYQSTIKQFTTEFEKMEHARMLLSFLDQWLNEHILVNDKSLVNFLSQVQSGRS
ncbi:MAG: hemerythrin family protein [Magnetococcus sp. XQGC-1]